MDWTGLLSGGRGTTDFFGTRCFRYNRDVVIGFVLLDWTLDFYVYCLYGICILLWYGGVERYLRLWISYRCLCIS